MGALNRHGLAEPKPMDTTPIELPMGTCRPTPLQELIARMVRDEVARETADEFETMDEADDFVEEDPDVLDFSPYELSALQEETPLQDGDNPASLPPEDEETPGLSPREVLDRAYGPGNYPQHWLNPTGDRPDPNGEEPG